jgi:pimeloyl-ACP methyl ester carboxylesterase
MRLISILVLLLLLVGLAQAQAYEPFFEEDDCPFPDESIDISCGYLYVPEDRSDPNSPEVALAVAIIPAASANPSPEPVIYLEGGPGGSGLYAAEDFQNHPLRQNHDIILFDQRGTGFSEPSLNCYEVEDYEFDGNPDEACYQRLLDEGINLNAYNSAASAADVYDLWTTLGYEQVNLWGISYGTRLGLTVLRDYPNGIRAVILDSVYPPEINSVEQGVTDTLRAFNEVFAQCAADAECSEFYPNLEDDFYSVVAAFNENPPVFEYDDGEEVYELELYGDDLLDAMFQTLYNSTAIPMLPLGITLLAYAEDDFDLQDGYDILSGYWTPETWEAGFSEFEETIFDSDEVLNYLEEIGDISDSEGMYNSVECAEEIPFNDLDAAFDIIDRSAPAELQEWLQASAEGAIFSCAIWAVDVSPSVENQRVLSDVPVLLISGQFDPVTPPSYAESALQGLSNGQHIVFPTGGHSESGSPGCAAEIAAAFLANPIQPVETTCIPQRVEWYVE